MRDPIRTLLLLAIGVLYLLSVPWYRTGGAAPEIWFGLPDWVAVAIGCYAAVAVLNCLAWLRTEIPDRDPDLGPELDPEDPAGPA
jgi:hypothetical protein